MKFLLIMPWFCRPCAIEKHVRLLLQSVKSKGITPVVATIYNSDWNLPYEEDVQLVKIKPLQSRILSAVIARTIPDMLLMPDIYNFTLRKKAVKQILKDVDFSEIGYIHSVCWPCTSHLIAADIKKATGKPWIAHFYDPWTDNPYRKIRHNYFKKLDAQNEKKVAFYADAITHLTPVTMDIWTNRYGSLVEGKQHILLMTYDKELYSRAAYLPQKGKRDKIVISFIGKLFYDRNLDDVIAALTYLRDVLQIDVGKRFIFRVIGEISKLDKDNIEQNGLNSFFDIVAYLHQDQLEQYYIDSDAFLLIESPQKQNVFFSSKLLDYFIYQRLVIGIGPLIGITHDLLEESGNIFIENGHPEILAEKLNILLDNPNCLNRFDNTYYKKFAPEILAQQYMSIISNI